MPLPPALDTAVQRLQRAAREAAGRTVESLGLAALSTLQVTQRDALLTAQYELNRKLVQFHGAFDAAFGERLRRELGLPGAAQRGGAPALPTGHGGLRGAEWESLHLVEDSEVEAQISADRFGLDIAHSCEWELREIEAYLGGLLPPRPDGSVLTNPLRPDIVGHAMVRGVNAVTDRDDTRRLLAAELGRSLAPLLRACYAAIVGDWRQAGLRPAGLSVRRGAVRAGDRAVDERADGAANAGDAAARRGAPAARSEMGNLYTLSGGLAGAPQAYREAFAAAGSRSVPGSFGVVDPGLASVIRRLAVQGSGAGGGVGASGWGEAAGDRAGSAAAASSWMGDVRTPPPNLIQAHREELRQATHGALDHLVIDVIGFLFEQILSDPKVPPQMARLLARLQLPVLRAALGDPAFFSSRRHPVRRFVNRLASLGASFDDFTDPTARAFLGRVRALVDDVVAGDFEQPALYEQQIAALEALVAERGAEALREGGTDVAAVLAQKEDEQRLHRLYAERLAGELKDVAAPAFLREFVARVWSRVLLRAAERDGGHGELSARLRQAGRDLFLSVQPKATPAQRKTFLAELPRLMQALTEGMDLIGWPAGERHAFFGELMPAHAEALKAVTARPLDSNLMARHVDGALARPLPSREEARRMPLPAADDDAASEALFSGDEAAQVGLVQEAAIDWDGQVDIDLDQVAAEADAQPAAVVLPGLPEMPTRAEASSPRQLAEQLQVGCAYQMHIEGAWHKVRLAHVSQGGTFCIFTRGARHQQTLSMTHRMLVRLCEAGRLRPIEQATLIERATARARRQLAQLGAAVRA